MPGYYICSKCGSHLDSVDEVCTICNGSDRIVREEMKKERREKEAARRARLAAFCEQAVRELTG